MIHYRVRVPMWLAGRMFEECCCCDSASDVNVNLRLVGGRDAVLGANARDHG